MRKVMVLAAAGWLCLAGAAFGQEPRYDAVSESCRPYRPGVIDRPWQVSAPRNPVGVGQPVSIGVREKYGETGTRRMVRARVVGAATFIESTPVAMVDDNFVHVELPRDFPTARALGPGIYTVLWLLADGGGVLACDGFVVR